MYEEQVHEHGTSDLVVASNLTRYLKAWRAARGKELGLNGPLPQAKVQQASGKSDKWYRMFEAGTAVKYDTETLLAIADCLGLDDSERMTLFLLTMGVPAPVNVTLHDDDVRLRPMTWILEQQGPRPAYISDENWGIVAFNKAMADWCPWVHDPEPNLMRYVMLYPEARSVYEGWENHVRVFLAMIRLEIAKRGHDTAIAHLLLEALEDPVIKALWDEDPSVVANRDGHHYRLRLPFFHNEPIDCISQVFIPSAHPHLRLVLMTWPEGVDGFITPPLDPQGK
ncbi:helix-turn-helix transcriptional regulator [Streptomyces sp. QH1-20]|uniref:helix-turn-helix transcriptional regulator n=1 Tax=Streptomyces sp. QH1-20 TaxID=3240934 RepID=UPI003518A819